MPEVSEYLVFSGKARVDFCARVGGKSNVL
jgi:hypothetical protein